MKIKSWYFSLLRKPLQWLTAFEAIADSHEQVASDPKHLIYVMRSPSTTDLLVAQRAAFEQGLPDPTEPLIINGKAFPRVFYVEDQQKRLEYRSIEPFKQLFEKHQQDPELNVLMYPLALFWGREPGKDRRAGRAMVSDIESPGRFKKFLLVLFSGRNILVRISQPVSLRTMVDSARDNKDALAQKLRRVARTHFARLRYAVAGPKLSGRKEIIEELLRLPAIRKAIEEEAKIKKMTQQEAERVAKGYLQEIAADYRESLIRFGDRFFTWLWRKLYRGISVKNSEQVRQLAQQGHEIIYVPCHRSHMDYLLLSYILYKEGLVPPHIAAGVNLNFFPVGTLFRRGGAFFIRRSFRGNKLYSVVFREYLSRLFHKGYAIEYFVEGGRSRTGRLLAPKTGMLAMTLQGQLRGITRPISFVPVYVGYEHVMEVNTYHGELQGKNKEKESIFQVFGILKKLRNFGTGFVTFGEPLRLSEYLDVSAPDWRDSVTSGIEEPLRPKWMSTAVNQLAEMLMRRINEGVAFNPMNLTALCLLSAERETLTKEELVTQVGLYYQLQKEVPYSLHTHFPEQVFNETAFWQHMLSMRKFEVEEGAAGEVVKLDQSQALSMTYYKNNILHAFIIPAVVARYARGHQNFSLASVTDFVQQMYPLVQAELFLSYEQEDLPFYVAALCEEFVRLGWLNEVAQANETNRYHLASRDTLAYTQLVLLANAAGETLARYGIVLELLDQSSMLSRNELERFSEAIAVQIGARHGIDAPEFYDKRIFSTLTAVLKDEAYILVAEDGSYHTDLKTQAFRQEVDFLLGSTLQRTIRESALRLLNKETQA